MASTVYVANPNNARIATRTSTNNLKTGVYDENVANNGSISTQSFLGTKLSVAATKPVANLTAKRTTLGDISNFMKVDGIALKIIIRIQPRKLRKLKPANLPSYQPHVFRCKQSQQQSQRQRRQLSCLSLH